MKLIYLANLRLPTEKAYGIQIAKTCEAIADLDCSVILLCPFRISKVKDNFFSYYGIKRNFTFKKVFTPDFYLPGFLNKIAFGVKSLYSALVLVFYALVEGADIFYTRDELVAYILSFFKKNIIFEGHRFSSKRKIFYSRFKKKNLKIVVISQGIKDDLVRFGIEDRNILIARDGVDLKDFNIDISKIDARKKLFGGLHKEAFERKKIAVYVGSLFSWKGVNIFSETAKYLCEKNVNYLLFVFGGTDKKDVNELKKELANIGDKLHPNLIPIFYFGNFSYKDVPYILKTADCLVLTGNKSESISAKYTSPLKMFEYMASGRPIVVQDLPSFREVLNEQNSILVKPGDAKELASGINKVFKSLDDDNPVDPDLPERVSRKALEDVRQYSWQKRAEKILDFIS